MADSRDDAPRVPSRSRVRRAWPFAAIAVLAACLALQILPDVAWLLALAILVLGVVATARVVRDAARNADADG